MSQAAKEAMAMTAETGLDTATTTMVMTTTEVGKATTATGAEKVEARATATFRAEEGVVALVAPTTRSGYAAVTWSDDRS
jgi:hypothetical protein